MPHVCPWQAIWTFDNVFRPLVHPPGKLFAPYVEAGMRVADIGCGAGFATIALAELVGRTGGVVAVDLQAEMLDMARQSALRAGVNEMVEFRQCRPDALGLDGGFDFINAFYMVHEVPDIRRFLEQVRQALRPGGRLFVAEPRLHVSGRAYSRMQNTAREAGLLESGRPPVRFSRASVFERR